MNRNHFVFAVAAILMIVFVSLANGQDLTLAKPEGYPTPEAISVASGIGINNAGNGRTSVARNSIAAAYGVGIGSATVEATSIPLPTVLAGVRVFLSGQAPALTLL